MSLDIKNQLHQSYETYNLRSIQRLVKQIPEDRRVAFAEELFCRAQLLGCQNPAALQEALRHLSIAQEEKAKENNYNGC